MKNQDNNQFDGIVVPPGCENAMQTDCGETVQTYTPPSYNPRPHGMRGKTSGISVPRTDSLQAWQNMSEYLKQFQGASLCLDLWSANRKMKWCGVLLEVGKDFLVLGDTTQKKISLIDLKPIHYIHIYCK